MREIKFRGWDGKRMDYDGRKATGGLWNGIFVPEGDTILMQFTGLKDKNRKEIYEGDIVKNIPSAFSKEEVYGEIVWFPGHCRFAMSRTDHYLDMTNTYEIIGNIYENPELPKGL